MKLGLALLGIAALFSGAVFAATLNEQLFLAVRDGRLEDTAALVREGANVNARDESLTTPLMSAVSSGRVEVAEFLIRAGADVHAANREGVTSLMKAAFAGNARLVRALLDAKAQVNLKDIVGRTALHIAARQGHVEVMELLLAAGADGSAQDSRFLGTPLHHAAIGGNADAVRCLLNHGCPVGIRDSRGATPLHAAVIGQRASTNVVQALLQAGADINARHSADGSTPLMWAASSEPSAAMLRFLVESHADLNATDRHGWTALMHAKVFGSDAATNLLCQLGCIERTNLSYAAAKGDLAAVKTFLAKRGADRPKQQELDDALSFAVLKQHAAIVKLLLAHRADPNSRLDGDWTPLLVACRDGNAQIARQLLAAGADVNLARTYENGSGPTPLMYAAAAMPPKFLEELIRKGARVNEVTPHGDTAVGWAAKAGGCGPSPVDLRNLKTLLRHGAKLDVRAGRADAYIGWPIVTAIKRGDTNLVEFLLAHGVDVNTRAAHGTTLLMYAVQYNQPEVVRLLLARGADWSAQADYDINNTARKLAENTGKTEVAALLRIAEQAGQKLKSAPVRELVEQILADPDASPAMKADAAILRDAEQQRLQAERVSAGQAPLDLKFKAVDGREVDLAGLRGKVVLVDFWATWCGPCRAEIPRVVAAYNQLHKDGFEIIGISLDSDKQRLLEVTRQAGMTWPQYFDGRGWDNEFVRRYRINAIPTMWLVDKQGRLRFPEVHAEQLAAQVQKLLAE